MVTSKIQSKIIQITIKINDNKKKNYFNTIYHQRVNRYYLKRVLKRIICTIVVKLNILLEKSASYE